MAALKTINFQGALEIYWDGQRIGQNGVIAAAAQSAKMGHYQYDAIIPPTLLKAGTHQVAVRQVKMGQLANPDAWLLVVDYFEPGAGD